MQYGHDEAVTDGVNVDFDVFDPAVPAATSAVTSAKVNAKRTRLISPSLAARRKRFTLSPCRFCHNAAAVDRIQLGGAAVYRHMSN